MSQLETLAIAGIRDDTARRDSRTGRFTVAVRIWHRVGDPIIDGAIDFDDPKLGSLGYWATPAWNTQCRFFGAVALLGVISRGALDSESGRHVRS